MTVSDDRFSKIICGDALKVWPELADLSRGSLVVIDPPWDAGLFNVATDAPNRLVFCDGYRASDAIAAHGPPTWVFVWDCVSSWYTPNRPLRRGKIALWYGRLSDYKFDGALHGDPCGVARRGSNSRGEYLFKPSQGKHLADVFSSPITSLRKRQPYSHAKPFDWCRMLVANCAGDAETVIDLFAGAGSFGFAAASAGMNYIGVEIDPVRAESLSNASFSKPVSANFAQEELWPLDFTA